MRRELLAARTCSVVSKLVDVEAMVSRAQTSYLTCDLSGSADTLATQAKTSLNAPASSPKLSELTACSKMMVPETLPTRIHTALSILWHVSDGGGGGGGEGRGNE